jgi:hypothetical protein
MLCLQQLNSTDFQLISPQPADYTGCTYLLAQPSELQPEIWNISVEQGLEIGGYLALVLVTGYTFRAMAQALKTDERKEDV